MTIFCNTACNPYLNNRLEQDHRGIKQRDYPMRGFGSLASAARFCRAFDELRNYLRPPQRMGETVLLAQHRQVFRERLAALQALMMAAS
jgi:putative transposase